MFAVCLRRGLFLCAMLGATSPTFASSSDTMPPECKDEHSNGQTAMSKLIADGADFSAIEQYGPILDDMLAQYAEDDVCRFYFSMGMFNMLTTTQKLVEAEYLLESMYAKQIGSVAAGQTSVDNWYESRLRKIGVTDVAAVRASRYLNEGKEYLATLVASLNAQADREEKVVPFGRFAFVGGQAAIFTLYDFATDQHGELVMDDHGQPRVIAGSIQMARERLLNLAVRIAQEFMEWRPALYFGEDSHWYGSFWRSLGFDKEPSPRELKEQSYFDQIRMIEAGLERLRADKTPTLRLRAAMIKKSRAIVESELNALKNTEIGLWAAPFVPVGMYVGGAMLAQSGWFAALPAGTTSGTFVGGSLASAANISAAATAGIMLTSATAGANAGVNEASHADAPFRFARILDQIVHSTIANMPQAGLFPVQVGVTVYGAKQLLIGSKWLMAQGAQYYAAASQAGVSGTLANVGRFAWNLPSMTLQLPQKFASHVIAAWWQQPKVMAVHYGADIVLTLVYEVGYRQFFLDGSSKFYYQDKDGKTHFNNQSLYSISSTLILSPISKPITLIPSFGGRWLAYRGMTLFTSVISHLIISGSVDETRLVFDSIYFGTAGTAFGEIDRMFKMSDFVKDQPAHRQFALLILFKALLINPVERPLRIFLQDHAVGGNLSGLETVREEIAKYMGVDLDGFSDEELEKALAQAQLDVRASTLPK